MSRRSPSPSGAPPAEFTQSLPRCEPCPPLGAQPKRALILGHCYACQAPLDGKACARELNARRLSREGWLSRGWVGSSSRSVVPTAAGVVEVNPGAADAPQSTESAHG